MSGQDQGSLIFRSGLNEVYDTGVYPNFSLKYFLPVYDARTDLDIHDLPLTTSTSAIQNSASVFNIDVPTSAFGFNDIEGEIIWNFLPATNYTYKIDYSGNIITNATTDPTTGTTASTTMKGKASTVNYVYNTSTSANVGRPAIGSPFTSAFEQYQGTDVVSQGNGGFTSTSNFTLINEVAGVPVSWDKTQMFDTIQYVSNQGDPNNYGVYQLRLPANTGSFKFNKLILFGQKVNTQGVDETVDPFPFAVVTLNETFINLNSQDEENDNNVTEFIADVAIAFTRNTSGASEITYNPDEYWTRIKNLSDGTSALEYPGSVLISPIDGGINEESPKSKLHLIEGDTTKPIMRISRQESSNNNDTILSVNPNTSATQLYPVGTNKSYEFGETNVASGEMNFTLGTASSATGGKHTFVRGDNVEVLNGEYTTLIGSNATVLGPPPNTPAHIIAVNPGADLSGLNSYVLVNGSNSTGVASFLDSFYIGNEPISPEHTSYFASSSIVTNVVPALSNVSFATSVAALVGATTSGANGIQQSLTIGNSNNYDDVYQSMVVGNSWSLTGPVTQSIIVGEGPNQFDPAFATPNFNTSGCIFVHSPNPPNLLYNMNYLNCFMMGSGHIYGGGLQPTSESDRNSMFLFGDFSMLASDYSVNMGWRNILNAGITQIDHTSAYHTNFAFGYGNSQDSDHTTPGYDFNRNVHFHGSRNYVQDSSDTFIMGGRYVDGKVTADSSDSENDIRRSIEGIFLGTDHTVTGSYQAAVIGKLATVNNSQRVYSLGEGGLMSTTSGVFNVGSFNTHSFSFQSYTLGGGNSHSFGASDVTIGNSNTLAYTQTTQTIGSSNALLGWASNVQIVNSIIAGSNNAVLCDSLNIDGHATLNIFGHDNSALGESVDSALIGVENEMSGSNNRAFGFGYDNRVLNGGTSNYLFGSSNFASEGTNNYMFGNNNGATSATGAYLYGNSNSMERDSLGSYTDNYMFGNGNFIQAGDGIVNNSYMIGINNYLETRQFSGQAGDMNANFIFGLQNAIRAKGGATPSPNVDNTMILGILSSAYADVYGDIFNSMMIGTDNTLKVSGKSLYDTHLTSITIVGSYNDIDSLPGSFHDQSILDETGLTIIGSNGDTSDLANVTKIFKIWDNVANNPIYSSNTNAIGGGNEVHNKMNLLITNGTNPDGSVYKGNAMGFGIMDTGISLFRHIIVLPIKSANILTGKNATNNPLNPSNPEYSLPTFDELETMKAIGKRPPMGTLCYDDGTPNTLPAADTTPLHVWLGQG